MISNLNGSSGTQAAHVLAGSPDTDGRFEAASMNGGGTGDAEQLAAAMARAENLEIALKSSRIIGMAMGILMERQRITSDAALDQLKQVSQSHNIKLRDLADMIVLTGQLPAKRRP